MSEDNRALDLEEIRIVTYLSPSLSQTLFEALADLRLREVPVLRDRLRVIETWGPCPIQPVVVRSALDPRLKERLRTAFLSIQADDRTREIANQFGLTTFVAPKPLTSQAEGRSVPTSEGFSLSVLTSREAAC